MNLSKALADRGHDVHLFTTDRAGVPDISWLSNVDVRVFKETFAPFSYAPDMSPDLKSLMPQVDLVHIHGLYLYPTIQAARVARQFEVPYIIRPAGALDPYHLNRKVIKKAVFDLLVHNDVLRNASAFHFTTDIEKEISQPRTYGRDGIVIPNGLNLSQIQALAQKGRFRERFPNIGSKRIVLFLGRINYKKGFEVLVPAFAEAHRQIPDIHLVIAGNDDGYLSAVQQLVADHKLVDNVTFAGFLGSAEKYEAYADADMFVLPSYSENFANALFEAMASGTPSIISNKVNSWPEIAAAQAAIVINPDVAELTAAIRDLISDQESWDALSKRAKDFSWLNYDWSSIANRIEIAYQSILSKQLSRAQASAR
jgi:glycosyltransferase involved in cell wall biosynthesis